MTYKYTRVKKINDVETIETWEVETFEELKELTLPNKYSIDLKPNENSEEDIKSVLDVWDNIIKKRGEQDQKIKSGSVDLPFEKFDKKYYLGDTSLYCYGGNTFTKEDIENAKKKAEVNFKFFNEEQE